MIILVWFPTQTDDELAHYLINSRKIAALISFCSVIQLTTLIKHYNF